MTQADFAIVGISELATPKGKKPLVRDALGKLRKIKNAALASRNGKIIYVGSERLFREKIHVPKSKILDVGGRAVIPGFVDPHTHLVFGGDRSEEFIQKRRGVSYEDIARKGGGILATVKATRKASKKELVANGKKHLDRALAHGTTTVEIKSGYGLDLKTEIKMLEAIKELKKKTKLDIVATFLGAHTLPNEYKGRREDYVKDLCETWIPEVARRKLADFCDVFCEGIAFSPFESRTILETAKRYGLAPKIHADQLTKSGGTLVGVQCGAASIDHADYASQSALIRAAKAKIPIVALPGCTHFLGLDRYPPVHKFIELGLPLALATDCNPGSSYTESMQSILELAVYRMNLTVEQALSCCTLNAAFAIGKAPLVGSLENGKQLDAVVLDSPSCLHLAYRFGSNHAWRVVKKGRVVWKA